MIKSLSYWITNRIIRQACQFGSEAAQLASVCLQEYPRPEKFSPELAEMFQSLNTVAQDSKYQQLEELLQMHNWVEADQETYRLMITAVGKEEGQAFTRQELLEFPCEELLAIDRLWVRYSQGRFGFSVQKQIYVECGGKLDGKETSREVWYGYCDRVGWRESGYLYYNNLKNPSDKGEFPLEVFGFGVRFVGFSSLASRLVNCSTSQS